MTLPRTEEDVVAQLLRGLRTYGEDLRWAREVRSHGRARMDVLLFDGVDLVGVEVKLSDWRRALAQAVLNRYCVDQSYVALWASKVSPEIVEEAASFGVGVLSVNAESVDVSHEAPRNSPPRPLRERMLETAFEEQAL